MSLLTDKQGRLDHLRSESRKMFDAKPDLSFTADEAKNLRDWNKEMEDLGVEIDQLKQLDSMRQSIGPAPRKVVDEGNDPVEEAGETFKNLRQVIAESEGLKSFKRRGQGTEVIAEFPEGVDAKTLISLSTVTPQNLRLPRIEPYPVERRTVRDLMMQGTIDRGVLEYYEETTFTNAAVEVTEGEAKPEAALDWTLRTETIGKIAVWIPATTESLDDIPWLESTIRNRLVFMIQRREEAELLNGDGTPPNISGITDRSGIQTQAKGADPTFDAILKAATLIQVNAFYDPDAVVMHPNDWRDLLLTRTADGIYILGNPGDPTAARRLWGLEVRATTAQTENTAIVGAFGTAAQVFQRSGIRVVVSTEHDDYLVKNKVVILAEERLGLAVYRPAAFATVTGI